MNRIYLFLALAMGITSAATAQTRSINLEAKMNKPTANSTVTVGTNFDVDVTFTNKGPDGIKATDSLYFAFSGSGGAYVMPIMTNKNVNDTIQLKFQVKYSSAPNGPATFCLAGAIGKGATTTPVTDPDTSNNDDCKTINITGGSTGVPTVATKVGNFVKENLSIIPNPASFDVKFDFVANSATEVKARVIDVTGREVYNHSFGKAYVGQTNYSLNISGLNNGIYFVELSQESRRAIGKMIKQ